MKFKYALLMIAAALPLAAHAWWNEAWTERRVVTLDTSATGVEIASSQSNMVVPIRLHSGNFDFSAANPDGSDIRFVAADDKTPLKFHLERFDAGNELAVAWVQVPQVAPKTAGQKIHLYFGNVEAPAEAATPGAAYDAATAAVFHFREGEANPLDASANANTSKSNVALEKAGLLGASAKFEGSPLTLAPSSSLKLAAGGALTYSAWLRMGTASPKAVLYRQGPVALSVESGKLMFQGAGQELTGGTIAPDIWQHITVVIGGGQATLFVNGASVATGPAALPEVQADVQIGEGLSGLLDEIQIAGTARSADWVKLAASAQGADSKLLAVVADEEAAEEGGSHSHFAILVDNLTPDAWAVIIVLMVMFVIAAVVMVTKTRMISQTDRDNRHFLKRFQNAVGENLLELDAGPAYPHSTLSRLYQAGIRETKKRVNGNGEIVLSGASVDAIKAAVDANLVRENHRLNTQMVLLTIAISGGPFLGLLGTVVGVMITFAAIAAAGDVNVNAIAPGIAAALLATVAGLAVAIPALFGYNYLASRIKNLSADMQIFVDEFITRLAENYGK